MTRSPPALFLAALTSAVTVALMLPEPRVPGGAWRWLGLLPVAAGVALHRAAWRTLRDRRTTTDPWADPSVLVRDGPFARTRNPMYLAGAWILAGVSLLAGSLVSLLVLPLWMMLTRRWYMDPEERALESMFGAEYATYRSRVPRWM